ncbi:MAG TPA: PIN domain-containing protein [Thermoanaerobaculia bacterium]|nr:PIN domain-containing protein [Thermoanaerobaculia bacterium]
MRSRILVDTGPLVALLNRRDRHHAWVKAQLRGMDAPLDTCEAVLSEACFLLRQVPGGPQALLELISQGLVTVSMSLQDEVKAIQRLLLRYADVPMALADACMVRLAEIHEPSLVFTLDSDFKIYRKHGRTPLPLLLPDDR